MRWMYSRCSASSVSTLIDRSFNAVNGRRFMPNLVCRKKTGPGDSRLIRIAAITKTGAVNTRRTVAPTTSTTRFVMREDRRTCRWDGEERKTLEQVDVGPWPDELEEARHEIHDDVLVSKRTDERHGPIVSLAREGDDDAIDLFVLDDPRHIVEPAE